MGGEEGSPVYVLSDEERELVRAGLDELDQGKSASDAEVRAVFDKYRACVDVRERPKPK